jgi:hypothetical protein
MPHNLRCNSRVCTKCRERRRLIQAYNVLTYSFQLLFLSSAASRFVSDFNKTDSALSDRPHDSLIDLGECLPVDNPL